MKAYLNWYSGRKNSRPIKNSWGVAMSMRSLPKKLLKKKSKPRKTKGPIGLEDKLWRSGKRNTKKKRSNKITK